MSLTITPSPFGSLTVSVAETNSTLSVTTVATSPSVLSMALGVPGPQGETGATGQGVAAGGTTGQALVKLSGTNYDTGWATITSGGGTWGSITGTLSNQTDLYNALNGKLSLSGGTMSGGISGIGSGDFGLIAYQATDGVDPILGGAKLGSQTAFAMDYAFVGVVGDNQTLGLYANGSTFIKFGDDTTQTTAYDPAVLGNYLPLTGGTVTGSISVYDPIGSSLEISLETGNGISVLDHATNLGTYLDQYGISFPNSTVQTTAFPPTGGTTSQYIDGTGALVTFPTTIKTAGQMVTSFRNNTGATLAKGTVVYINGQVGNKPTVAKAQANTEATSKATYGFVETAVANNTDGNIVILGLLENIDTQGFSDGDLLYLSPTVAGGWTKTQPFSPYHYVRVGTVIRGGHPTQGSIAVQVTNGFQLDEMSDVGATAPSNANVLTWDSTASQWLDKSISTILGYTPLSSTTASATYQTISGMSAYQSTSAMSAYLSTSAAASTYQTQSGMSAYLSTASASANYIGTSAYATTAQAQAGTSSSTVISPSTLLDAKYFAGGKSMVQISWATAVSGTGASAGAQNANARLNVAPSTGAGYAIASAIIANTSRGQVFNSGFDFSKRVSFGLRVARNVANPDTNSVWRFSIGKTSATDASDLSMRGLMIKIAGAGALQLLAHNGTTLSTATSTYTPSNGSAYDVVATSDGAGNCALFVNGSSVATTTGGPTSAGSANFNYMMFETQNTATISSSPQSICISDYYVQVNS